MRLASAILTLTLFMICTADFGQCCNGEQINNLYQRVELKTPLTKRPNAQTKYRPFLTIFSRHQITAYPSFETFATPL